MTQTTIPEVATEANTLFTALAGDLDVNLALPDLTLSTDFPLPDETDNPAYAELDPLTIAQLTTGVVNGTGVFDELMAAMNSQLSAQYEKGRITGGDFAKVYLGGIQSAMQTGLQFLLSRDQTYLANLQTQANIQLAQAQKVRAMADVEIARAQIQQMAYTSLDMRFKAYTSRNEYALSKMNLVVGYNGILTSEAQALLTGEQVDAARAQTKDTLVDGSPILGVIGMEKGIKEVEKQVALEGLDTARASTKDTLLDGSAIGGTTAVDKEIKEAQRGLVVEQTESQRAQTWDLHSDGSNIVGILAAEKALKTNQAKLVMEQYESQRGQTRATLSTGETVVGVLGAQTKLYNQQVTSYQRDAESKFAKLMLDTWTARKTIDEGVAVPANIDTPAINTMVQTYRTNLDL